MNSCTGLHGASKAAATKIADILRLALALFGVTVVIVLVGAVDTNVLAGGANSSSHPTPRYLSVKREINAGAKDEDRG